VFDPVSILRAAKRGLDPSAYTVLRPDAAYFKRERFGNNLGRAGAIVVAVVAVAWLLLIRNNGAFAAFFPNPLVRAGVYLYPFAFALAGLAAGFVFMPRMLERQSRQALILTPDGLILADWEQSVVVRAIDYRATKLTLEVDTNTDGPDLYRLITRQHGKSRRWTIAEYFEEHPAKIASRVMGDYARAKERG
jgi:hypothetical protein